MPLIGDINGAVHRQETATSRVNAEVFKPRRSCASRSRVKSTLLKASNMSKRNVAQGFVTDATRLIQDFAARKSSDFADFQDVWKKKKFAMIFLGRPSEKELLEFTNQILRITLELFDNAPKETKLGYLFLLYGLFRYQPLKPPAKARITLEHFKDIEKLRDEAEAEGNKIVLFIVRYMVRNGFEFVGAPTLMGPTVTNAALKIELPTETEKKLDDVTKQACQIQDDMETCFQELKLVKRDYEELIVTQSTSFPSSVAKNVPFAAFLEALEPYSPHSNNATTSKDNAPTGNNNATTSKDNAPTSNNNASTSNSTITKSNRTANQVSGDIGRRRILLKSVAYNKAIAKAARYESKKKKEIAKNKKRGRPRKVQEPNKVTPEQDLVPKAAVPEAIPYRGQKREKLFKGCKEKYHSLGEIKTKNDTE